MDGRVHEDNELAITANADLDRELNGKSKKKSE